MSDIADAPRKKPAIAQIASRGAATRATGTGLRGPEAIVLYKLLVIGVVSFGFATIVTFIYSSGL